MRVPSRMVWRLLAPLTAGLLLVPVSAGRSQETDPQDGPQEWTVSPAAAPVPSFKHRLWLSTTELVPGDAAPIYLRTRYELGEGWESLVKKPPQWLELPDDQFPVAEAREFVDQWEARLQQITFGVKRQSCDWNYTLSDEKEQVYGILLPDLQGLRVWGRLLALKARVEMAEGKLDEALETIRTGLMFGEHLSRGPFVINTLVGIAVANSMVDQLEKWMARPGAPNLYWALARLPRPLVRMRQPIETEQATVEWVVPELTRAESVTTAAEATAVLERLHERLRSVEVQLGTFDQNVPKAWLGLSLDELRTKLESPAREFLRAQGSMTDQELRELSADAAILRYMVARYRELRDVAYRAAYLPWPEAIGVFDQAEKIIEQSSEDPATAMFAALMPHMGRVQAAGQILERRLAMLRAVEALRWQAEEGQLPESLSDIHVAPVPRDPVTGKPFGYRLEDGAAVLSCPSVSEFGADPGSQWREKLEKAPVWVIRFRDAN